MAEFHPFFVHFPVALLSAAALFDLYGALRKQSHSMITAYVLQLMAAISSILAAFSGNLAETALRGQELLAKNVSESLSIHISFGNSVVWIIVLLAIARTFAILEKKNWTTQGWLFPIMSMGLAGLVLVTGLLGGALSQDILQYFINH